MPEKTMIDAIRQAMDEELGRDERVFIVGEDVGVRGGVFRSTQGLYEKYGPDRVIDSPLAEVSIVGVGIGAALYGLRPICEIQFADFIFPAINQIINEAAKMCYRSNGEWGCPIVIRARSDRRAIVQTNHWNATYPSSRPRESLYGARLSV